MAQYEREYEPDYDPEVIRATGEADARRIEAEGISKAKTQEALAKVIEARARLNWLTQALMVVRDILNDMWGLILIIVLLIIFFPQISLWIPQIK